REEIKEGEWRNNFILLFLFCIDIIFLNFFAIMQAFSVKKWYDIKSKRIHLFRYKVFVKIF
ncbi:hypothetical protein, partial [Lactobacillus gasseri]|uniref:hypothetical protein n=1 Tax=Lactobacillus gasseri TaxID=1596 RepID=UPI0022E343ED